MIIKINSTERRRVRKKATLNMTSNSSPLKLENPTRRKLMAQNQFAGAGARAGANAAYQGAANNLPQAEQYS